MTDTNLRRAQGRIIKISKDGWGFISSKEIEFTRIFFHWTSLVQDTLRFPELKAGMRVEFTPTEIPGKGWRAIHIKIVEREKVNEEVISPTNPMPALPE